MKTFVLNGWAAAERAWDLCLFPRDRVFGYTEQLDGLPEKAIDAEKEVLLVGWSMGGSTALRMAATRPERIAGLVLVAATARMMKAANWAGMTERRLAALEAGLKMTKGEGLFAAEPGRPNPYMTDTDANLERGLAYLRETDLRMDLIDLMASGRLRCPVQVIQGEKDGVVRPENARFLAAVFPEAKVTMVPGGDHALPVSAPEAIDVAVAEISDFWYNRRERKDS